MPAGEYDLVVIGGGIHGAGVAQAAAAVGQRVLLLEKRQPAAGTSSRSSKLIHGGLRYLETGQIGLVRESLRERELLLKLAPGLVHRVPFFIPVYRQTQRRPWQIRIGLSLYALLGGLTRNARFHSVPRRDWGCFMGLKTEDLQAVFQYFDAQTDDAALTRAVVKSAESLGAESQWPAEFVAAHRTENGFRVDYRHDGDERLCEATCLVNAAGPWINGVRERIFPPPPGIEVDLVQGAHIVLDRRLCDGVLYVESPQDGRAVFIMPWGENQSLVGTTETAFTGRPDDVQALPEEIAYLEGTLRHYFPACDAATVGQFAGLRVLPHGEGSAFRRTRETILVTDDDPRPRYVAIYGGKLTGYRATAEKVLQRLRRSLPARSRIASTRELPLTCVATRQGGPA
jgi:glycerol-3-phosphate dehydrogenase